MVGTFILIFCLCDWVEYHAQRVKCVCFVLKQVFLMTQFLTGVVENQVAVFYFVHSCVLCKQARKFVKSSVRNLTVASTALEIQFPVVLCAPRC